MAAPPAKAGLQLGPNIYESLGVRPIINCRGTFTVLGGSMELPEVRAAKDIANQKYVQMERPRILSIWVRTATASKALTRAISSRVNFPGPLTATK